MDREQRGGSSVATDIMANVLAAHQAGIWTAMPGIVEAVRKAGTTGMVVDVKLAVQVQQRLPDAQGTVQWLDLPLILDCPILFQGGGGFTLTFPVAAGDECLVLFASKCINTWFQNGQHQNQQEELRMHDLSDGFALVGVRSKPRTLSPQFSATAVELRSDDGTTKISVEATKVKVTAPSEIVLTAPTVTINAATTHMTGNLQVDGDIHADGDVVADTVSLHDHIHHGVDRGSQDTDPPTP